MPRKKPIKIVTLDTETYNGLIGGLKRIAIYDGEKKTYGYTFSDIEPELLSLAKKFTVEIYVHNLEFDARKIPEIFEKDRVQWGKCFVINNKFATVSCKKYTFHDSFKILPMGLKKLSEDFEVTHGKLDLWEEVQTRYPGEYKDLVDFLDRCDKDDPLYLEYLGYDVISLYEVVMKLIEISGLEVSEFVKKISTASLSRHLFKNGYKGEEFKNPLNTKTDYEILCQYNWVNALDIEEFLRAGYCGGRTEVFKPLLNTKANYYDINSMYPFVMEEHDFPVGKPEFYNTPNLAKEIFETWQRNKIGMGYIHAHVFIPQQHIPPLPVKMGKLVFPCGEVHGTWTFHELQYAIEECGVEILETFEVCFFSNTYPVFRNFIHTFYEMKEQATIDNNESLRTFSKLIQNVGYGYTGMSRDKTQILDIKELPKHPDAVFVNEDLGYIESPADIKSDYIQVQVAGYVTSFARLELLKALRYADEKGEVYYCDTDSLVTDVELPADMVHDTRLGAWSLEKEPIKGLFLRPKVYALVMANHKTSIKFKGISKETSKELTFSDYETLYRELVEDVEEYEIVERNRVLLRSIMYMKKNNIDFDYYETRDKKMNLRTIEKRIMNYEENYTTPHYFKDLDTFQNFTFKRAKQIVHF